MDPLDRFMRDLVGPHWRIDLYLLAGACMALTGVFLVSKKAWEGDPTQPAM